MFKFEKILHAKLFSGIFKQRNKLHVKLTCEDKRDNKQGCKIHVKKCFTSYLSLQTFLVVETQGLNSVRFDFFAMSHSTVDKTSEKFLPAEKQTHVFLTFSAAKLLCASVLSLLLRRRKHNAPCTDLMEKLLPWLSTLASSKKGSFKERHVPCRQDRI